MYNRYQQGREFAPVAPEAEAAAPPASPVRAPEHTREERPSPSPLLGEVAGGFSKLLEGLLGRFSLKGLDTGDILLVLIILFLYLEGDNLELVITLGLMLLLGLGDDE